MRCNNCGWDNAPGVTNCVKCGHPLQVSEPSVGSSYGAMNVSNSSQAEVRVPRPTVVGTSAIRQEINHQELRKTVVTSALGGLDGRGGYSPRPTVPSSALNDVRSDVEKREVAPRPTVKANDLAGMGYKGSRSQLDSSDKRCPKCGLLIGGDYTSCPGCGAIVGGSSHVADAGENVIEGNTLPSLPEPPADINVLCPNCKSEVSAKFVYCPMCGERIMQDTLPGGVVKPKGPQCSLTIVPDEDEQNVGLTNFYEGETVVLNRDNTEMTNRTITSREQAVLIHEEGKWYLENRSEQCSTYLEANRRLELVPGDIVMLGDRRFKFNAEVK